MFVTKDCNVSNLHQIEVYYIIQLQNKGFYVRGISTDDATK